MATMTATPAPAAFVSASLYVGDLAPDVIESKLFDIFNSVGPVASIRVCRDSMLKRSLGYAYVNFHNQPDALRALNTLNYTEIQGRPCRIMWSQRDPSLRKSGQGNVFVKNLHPEILHKELQEAFSVFGNILSCKVAVDAADGKSKGYGYVQFESEEAAKSAIEKLNGQELKGKAVEVKAFQKKSSAARTTQWTNLYVKNVPTHLNEADFVAMFKEFGEIKSAKLMSYSEEDAAKDAASPNPRGVKAGASKGFGFVDFAEHDAAEKAVEALNGKMLEHPEAAARIEAAVARARAEGREIDPKYKAGEPVLKPLFTARAQPKAERVRELKAKYLQHRAESENNVGKNLYIKNLDETVDDEQLHQAFQGFGTITSARIMRYPDNSSRGFGFVCFSTAEEASRANHEMMGKSINSSGKPMYVALAQAREQRQQLLNQQMMNRAQMGGFPRGPMGGNMYNSGMPVMYPGMPRQGFPMMGGYPRGAPRGPAMYPARPMPYVQMPGQPMGPGMMPPQQQGMYQQGQQRRQNRGPAGPRQGGPAGPAGMPMQARGPMPARPQQAQGAPRSQPQQPGIKFTQNVRNQPGQVPVPAQSQAMAPAVETPGGALTLAALAAADEAQQKNMIGERLYPLIQHRQPEYCGKITGMLLEMDNSELLHLLESDEALDAKINEAMDVLRQHFQASGIQG